jgi:tRNA-2-methylthio-N6-dimethylallyladenosine synthase
MPRVYFETYGCQMNAYDTEVISSLLESQGFATVADPEESDVIIVNTCSVREHAERRAIGRLNDLSRHESAVLAVCGCMAQRMGKSLFEAVPGLDVVAGTDTYRDLASMIRSALERKRRIVMTDIDGAVTYSLADGRRAGGATRYLGITRGCENFCSYCIVPYVRGRVRSKDPSAIVREIAEMTEAGAKEVTLLGQNVMAYRNAETGFMELIRRIIRETGVERLRFLTTHPRDLDLEIFRIMAADRRLCPHIHLPVQSGSDRILGLMKRGYSGDRYEEKVAEARRIVPDLAVTTDVIVGFPTETDDDFRRTLALFERCRFEAAFTFKYSPRPGTAAAMLEDDVPTEVKKDRLSMLNEKVQEIRKEILTEQLGSDSEILLDDTVKKGEYHFGKGRTPHFRNVLVPATRRGAGEVFEVRLEQLRNFTFIGREI